MVNLLRSEFYRTTKFKSIYIAPAIMFVVLLAVTLLFNFMMSQFEGAVIPDGAQMGMFYYSGKSLIYQAVSNSFATILIAIIISILVAGSFNNGSIKNYVSRGANRIKLYFSKLVLVLAIAVATSLLAFLFAGILSPIMGYGGEFTAKEFGGLMATIGMQTLVIIAYASLFLMIAVLLRSTGGAVGLSIAFIIFEGFVTGIFITVGMSTGSKWMIDSIQALLTTQATTAATIGTLETWEYLCVILIPLAYIAVTNAIALFSFIKRDIK